MTQYLSQWTPAKLLLASFLVGIGLSAFYDLARIRRRLTRGIGGVLGFLLVTLEDIVFFAVAGVVCSLMFYGICNGEVRMLGLAGLIPGFLLWRATAGRLILSVLDRIIALSRRIVKFIWNRIAEPPVRWISLKIAKLVNRVLDQIERKKRARYTRMSQEKAILSAKRGFMK